MKARKQTKMKKSVAKWCVKSLFLNNEKINKAGITKNRELMGFFLLKTEELRRINAVVPKLLPTTTRKMRGTTGKKHRNKPKISGFERISANRFVIAL